MVKPESDKVELSHIDADGTARMVDVSTEAETVREATVSTIVATRIEVLDAIMGGTLAKGDAIATARIAGIQGAKRTHELIPLCHPLPLTQISVEFERAGPTELRVTCRAKAAARTGVEMEALTGASIAALTIYDMAKSADRSIRIGPMQLDHKSGGASGTYRRAD